MLAGIMLLLLFFDSVVTVVLLMRYREISRNEKRLREEMRIMCAEETKRLDGEQKQLDEAVNQANEILSNTSPEDLNAAMDLLRKMGLDA